MELSEYINWIIRHPENFTFIHNIIEPNTLNIHLYHIHYKDPDTGRINSVMSFIEESDSLVDSITRLKIANKEDILLDRFRELAGEKL